MKKFNTWDDARDELGYYSTFLTEDELLNQEMEADYLIMVDNKEYYVIVEE